VTTLEIAKVWVPSADEWDRAWESCPYSTYFQSRDWAEIWAGYQGGRFAPDPLAVLLSDGQRILLPLSCEKILRRLVRRRVSSPAGTFGGWLADRSLDGQAQQLVMQLVARQFPDLAWRNNPFEPCAFERYTDDVTGDETHVISLDQGFDAIFRSWTKGHASASQKARREGVETACATSEEEWKEYFLIYQNSLQRWGDKATLAYSWDLFEGIFRRRSPNVRLWIARHQGRMVAGALCLYSPSHVVYWHGAALDSHFKLRPVNLLIHDAIHDACERGYKWFDFNPSGGLEGVKAFKRSFGAVPMKCDIARIVSWKAKILFGLATLKGRLK
jgi:CelD/BcsL family acetyltransferase involved in cellulose biosynthesis